MSRLTFCTIARASMLPHTRVLADRLGQHHQVPLTVLRLGEERADHEDEPFDVLWPEDFAVRGWEGLLRDARWEELKEFFKPHLLSRLTAAGAAAVYLDPTVDVWARLDPVHRELEGHGAVLAPRLLGELPSDGRRPDRRDLQRAGRFGASLIALGPNAAAAEVVRWWTERLAKAAFSLSSGSARNGKRSQRTMTRPIDLAPSVFAAVGVLTDRGSALSYWNLHERQLDLDGSDFTVDGRALRFVHFEGFDPSKPFLLNVNGDRIRTSENPALAELCESYSARLLEAGWRDLYRRSEIGRRLPNRLLFDDRMSALLAEAADTGEVLGDVFTEAGAEAFTQWLAGPAPYGASSGVNRYLYALYRQRDDLRAAFPNLDGRDGDGFMGWAVDFGAEEMGIHPRFLPDRSPRRRLRPATRATALASRRSPLPRGRRPDLSVDVTGLFTGTLGLGEAARGYVRALQAVDVPVSTTTVDVSEFVTVGDSPHEGYARIEYADIAGVASNGFKLVCINPDELPRFAETVDREFFDRPVIGVWAWETDQIPERWSRAFELLDEIWVYSSYVAENLGRAAPVPVHRIPPPVMPPDPAGEKLDLGLPGGFQFLFMFDFFSTIQRKNPVGLIEAFSAAFEPEQGPRLVVKTINGVHRPKALEEVLWAARGRPDVHVIDRSLSARERDALVTGCDCYVSLHRSEGFGLTLAECMSLGKPVIGTAFSATTDFMTEENSYPVSFAMTRVGHDCEIYPSEGTWAEPDVSGAAALMRRVIEHPDEAREKGERARADIARLYSPQTIGELARRRLDQIRGLWA